MPTRSASLKETGPCEHEHEEHASERTSATRLSTKGDQSFISEAQTVFILRLRHALAELTISRSAFFRQ